MSKRWSWPRRQPVWADDLDFVGPRVRTAAWAWALLLGGLVAGIWVWAEVSRVDTEMAEARMLVKRLQRAEHQAHIDKLARSQPSKANAGGAASPLSPDGARHAAQFAQWLAYPWLSVLEQAESSAKAEQAVMLSFSLDLAPLAAQTEAQAEVRAVAAITDDDAALRWAHAQGASAQLLHRERLAAPFVTSAGRYEWRVEASWPGAQP